MSPSIQRYSLERCHLLSVTPLLLAFCVSAVLWRPIGAYADGSCHDPVPRAGVATPRPGEADSSSSSSPPARLRSAWHDLMTDVWEGFPEMSDSTRWAILEKALALAEAIDPAGEEVAETLYERGRTIMSGRSEVEFRKWAIQRISDFERARTIWTALPIAGKGRVPHLLAQMAGDYELIGDPGRAVEAFEEARRIEASVDPRGYDAGVLLWQEITLLRRIGRHREADRLTVENGPLLVKHGISPERPYGFMGRTGEVTQSMWLDPVTESIWLETPAEP